MRNNEYPVKYICKLPKSTIKELTDLGYDEEHINVYLASVKTE
ncbi:unnamed protein product [marine sediment metagenome]|uniref:Uncharacterized protein n=1 Tax=marine sediment metagenome TaxID=412755 RepID=X1VWN9_9ZZZZ